MLPEVIVLSVKIYFMGHWLSPKMVFLFIMIKTFKKIIRRKPKKITLLPF